MAAHDAHILRDLATTGETEILPKMTFFGCAIGKAFHSLGDLHEALFALALLAAGSWNFYAQQLGAIEKRCARHRIALLGIEV